MTNIETSGSQRYFRNIIVDEALLMQVIQVPKGFDIVAIYQDPEIMGLTLRVSCPPEEKYAVDIGQIIPSIKGTVHIDYFEDRRIQVRVEWDL